MSSDKEIIIENFRKRFLKLDKAPKSFKHILDMEPRVLKDCDEAAQKKLNSIKIHTIRDLTKINISEVVSWAFIAEIEPNELRKWIVAANMVKNAWHKRSTYLKKEESKIIVLGLDNAGKTSMLEVMQNRAPLGEESNISPTLGVEIKHLESKNLDLVIWDFGGQEKYRNKYLKFPEQYFVALSMVIYVIDMQDADRFNLSLEYFQSIIEIIDFLEEKPFFLIFKHKSDPDILEDPDFQINDEFIEGELEVILKKKNIYYEMANTSIYNFYKTQPQFATVMKRFFENKEEKMDTTKYLDVISSTLIKLSTTILDYFESISQQVDWNQKALDTISSNNATLMQVLVSMRKALANADPKALKDLNIGSIPEIAAGCSNAQRPLPPPPPPKKDFVIGDDGKSHPREGGPTLRTEILSELKTLFKKSQILK